MAKVQKGQTPSTVPLVPKQKRRLGIQQVDLVKKYLTVQREGARF